MKYAIIGHSRLHNSHFNLAKENVLLWDFKKSCIAQFFSSLNSHDTTNFSYVFYSIADDGSLHIGDFVEDFLTLGNVRLDIDDEYLHDYLTCGHGDISSTGWSQLKLLPPGKVMIKSDKYPIRFDNSWSPIFHQARKTSPSCKTRSSTMFFSSLERSS